MTSFRPTCQFQDVWLFSDTKSPLKPYCLEPERASNSEDDESGDDRMKERLEGKFWCTCERCEVMPTPRECVCCREQPESETR